MYVPVTVRKVETFSSKCLGNGTSNITGPCLLMCVIMYVLLNVCCYRRASALWSPCQLWEDLRGKWSTKKYVETSWTWPPFFFSSPQHPCGGVIYKANHCSSSSDFISKLNHSTLFPHLASKKGQNSPAKIEKSISNSDMKGVNEHFSVSLEKPNW